jgi:hypothetical protein
MGLRCFPEWAFTIDRMDTWVLWVSIAIPVVCIVGLGLWHLVAYVARKLPKKPRTVRLSPEPPSPIQSAQLLARGRAPVDVPPTGDDPERLQQACAALEDSLAERYLELAECWLRRGRPQKAVAVLNKILQVCPERPQAQLAQDRLQEIGKEVEGITRRAEGPK